MNRTQKVLLTILLISLRALTTFGQEDDLEVLSASPKSSVLFPLDYKIVRPELEYPNWDRDFDKYLAYLTPTIRKTQAALSFTEHGVVTTITPNSIVPHAQLDTNTIVNDEGKLTGTWRMLVFRSIRFTDSVHTSPKHIQYYRLPDMLIDDKSADEAFAVLTDNSFKLFAKEQGKKKFDKKMSSKYTIENRRFMLCYKFNKASGGVSQFGIDEKGFLILNYPKVIERIKESVYISYTTVIEQYIFERTR